jgi:hypothetical protein
MVHRGQTLSSFRPVAPGEASPRSEAELGSSAGQAAIARCCEYPMAHSGVDSFPVPTRGAAGRETARLPDIGGYCGGRVIPTVSGRRFARIRRNLPQHCDLRRAGTSTVIPVHSYSDRRYRQGEYESQLPGGRKPRGSCLPPLSLFRQQRSHNRYLLPAFTGDQIIALEKRRIGRIHRSGRIVSNEQPLNLKIKAEIDVVAGETVLDAIRFGLIELSQKVPAQHGAVVRSYVWHRIILTTACRGACRATI